MENFEESALSEREKMALRYADRLKLGPWGPDDAFLAELKRHFSDAEICEIGYVSMAYGGAHNFLSSIGERVFGDDGRDLELDGGFPLVFDTHTGVTTLQSSEESAVDGPLPKLT